MNNPFGSQNPFDPTASQPQGVPSGPWSAAAPPSVPTDAGSVVSGYSAATGNSASQNPFATYQQQPAVSEMTGVANLYGQNPYAAPPPPMIQPLPTPPQQQQQQFPPGNNPFAPATQQNAMVISTQQSNPYANYIQPPIYQQPQQQQQQLVPSANPFAMQQYSYENRAVAPAPVVMPSEDDPLAAFDRAPDAPEDEIQDDFVNSGMAPKQPEAKEEAAPPSSQKKQQPVSQSKESAGLKEAPDHLESPKGTTYPPQFEYGQKAIDESTDVEVYDSKVARNPYSEQLARMEGASPLPRADLVRKRGFVLSRISFRTIVLKKWKQSFWVQYGPHTMLWFRSQSDFDDWLNNPYHSQSERNFLIKLAVNFVHDLYKPNVRGYQVTQCRTKAYGNKMVRQFKLERWMDYGPTIAAAFGSYNPKEVDALREALVECMRNTPLNGGIRATGAVRQRPENENHHNDEDSEGDYRRNRDQDDPSRVRRAPLSNENRVSSYDELPPDPEEDQQKRKDAESVAEEADLLDVNNWDDMPVEPPQSNPLAGALVPVAQQQPHYTTGTNGYGYPDQPPQQQQQPQPPPPPQQHFFTQATMPQQQPMYSGMAQQQKPPPQSNAIVPTNASPAYPGAPPMPYATHPQQSYAPAYPPQQTQPYQNQNPWGSPQQQY